MVLLRDFRCSSPSKERVAANASLNPEPVRAESKSQNTSYMPQISVYALDLRVLSG